jgi:CDP-glucose 4,6-dehydratase
MNLDFWHGKTVFITGHTGFKGGWLSTWLISLGAKVVGYSLPTSPEQFFFNSTELKKRMDSLEGDVCDIDLLRSVLKKHNPEIVLHLAAQSLVRESYSDPIGTYMTNVMGTVNVLEACRSASNVRAIVNVTTDKCYENREWVWGYREGDRLGGLDPYSNSKACSELVTHAYRNSFFGAQDQFRRVASIATARAGNVIGGGDRAVDRIIPDMVEAIKTGSLCPVRNPESIRPWQHVLDPLRGYLMLAEHLHKNGDQYAGAWNFGPATNQSKSVHYLVSKFSQLWGVDESMLTLLNMENKKQPHEAQTLSLDSSKANHYLNWIPVLNIDSALSFTVEWEKECLENGRANSITLEQIAAYQNLCR